MQNTACKFFNSAVIVAILFQIDSEEREEHFFFNNVVSANLQNLKRIGPLVSVGI